MLRNSRSRGGDTSQRATPILRLASTDGAAAVLAAQRSLFGPKHPFVRFGLVDARAVWYRSIGAIVIGHVIAVCLAHCVTWQAYSDRRVALRSQWPRVALMIFYTMTGLWIVALPIVTTR